MQVPDRRRMIVSMPRSRFRQVPRLFAASNRTSLQKRSIPLETPGVTRTCTIRSNSPFTLPQHIRAPLNCTKTRTRLNRRSEFMSLPRLIIRMAERITRSYTITGIQWMSLRRTRITTSLLLGQSRQRSRRASRRKNQGLGFRSHGASLN